MDHYVVHNKIWIVTFHDSADSKISGVNIQCNYPCFTAYWWNGFFSNKLQALYCLWSSLAILLHSLPQQIKLFCQKLRLHVQYLAPLLCESLTHNPAQLDNKLYRCHMPEILVKSIFLPLRILSGCIYIVFDQCSHLQPFALYI